MIQDFDQAINYLYTNLPIFQRIGPAALKKDLANTLELCKAFGNPERSFRSIHVAGTNGKGSVSHMLAAILQSAGYKTGLYTSPHLKSFTERIRINGLPIREDYVVEFVKKVKPLIERIKPSFFEITVIMAFEYFASENIDVAIIETGLGGRLDSTNVITPDLSIITNISMDHSNILGDSIVKIASEKAGIIKQYVPVIVSERQPECEEIFIKKAEEMNSSILFASDHYQVTGGNGSLKIVKDGKEQWDHLAIGLLGDYQFMNVAGVCQAMDILNKIGYKISEKAILTGLQEVVKLTGLKGRWQKLGDRPYTVCDTGHNAEGIRLVMDQIGRQVYRKLHMIMGFVNDKDIDTVLRQLPTEATYYFCQANIPRAMHANELMEQAKKYGLIGKIVPNVNDALLMARQLAYQDDMIFIGGSTFVVAEIEEL